MSEWISVEDRLPEVGQWIFIEYKNPLRQAQFGAFNQWALDDGRVVYKVKKWMPLPQASEC